LVNVTFEGRVTGMAAPSGVAIPAICPNRQEVAHTSNAKAANVRFMPNQPD
jgi:hypothetical protein